MLATQDGRRLGLLLRHGGYWRIECDLTCEPWHKRDILSAETTLRAHWLDVHGFSEVSSR